MALVSASKFEGDRVLLATRFVISLRFQPFFGFQFLVCPMLSRVRCEETERQCSQFQDALADSQQQREVLEGAVCNLQSELQRAQDAVGRLIPDQHRQQQLQQHEQQQQQERERELENKVEMLKIQLAMQEQRCAADSFKMQGAFDATLAYLESRARSSLARMAERLKVECFRRQRLFCV